MLGTFHLGSADIWGTTIGSPALKAFEKNTAELWLFATDIEPGVSGPPKGASVDFAVKILERLPELIPQSKRSDRRCIR